MVANAQHEDLIKFVSDAWTMIVENSRGPAPIIYKCNVPEQTTTSVSPNSRNSYSQATGGPVTNNNSSGRSNSSSSSSGSSNNFRQQ